MGENLGKSGNSDSRALKSIIWLYKQLIKDGFGHLAPSVGGVFLGSVVLQSERMCPEVIAERIAYLGFYMIAASLVTYWLGAAKIALLAQPSPEKAKNPKIKALKTK